jgi:hypothetical protein
MFTWADNGACPAWAEREDAAARSVKRIREDLATDKCFRMSPEAWDAHIADIIREEQAKEKE